jgi:anti-anti-sigma regulatory factor
MTKDNNKGLLSKVVKFVRHPLTNWSDLDQPQPTQDNAYSKQALKEMIERKRQNDFVRKHEFDHLRKLRQREPLGGADRAGRPSFFQSSIPSNPDERAMTLKKIDEIEAQMSKQWWKNKQDQVTTPGMLPPMPAKPSARPETRAASKRAADAGADGFATTQASGLASQSSSAQRAEFGLTQMGLVTHFPAAPSTLPPVTESNGTGTRSASAPARGVGAGFSSTRLSASALKVSVTDPDLEEAAIGFANGDYAGVEAGLLDALQRDTVNRELAEVWMSALFGLYRATGQQARFDATAIDFAERFGRSAPAWFSVPDLLGHKASKPALRSKASGAKSAAVWASPAELDVAALDALCSLLTKTPAPWHLDWSLLSSIAPEAVALLARLFADWCLQPVHLRFSGAGQLEKTLRFSTPSGDTSVDAKRWLLRMDTLRIMGQQNEFEMVALDYCVTFEVSPPSWQAVRCSYVAESAAASGTTAESGATLLDDALPSAGDARTPDLFTFLETTGSAVGELELAGEIVGDAAQALAKLEVQRNGADGLVINCQKLIRVDFSAAGSILNWVADRQAEGCQVQFRDVHPLVAAFFNIIGINEHASVVLGAS